MSHLIILFLCAARRSLCLNNVIKCVRQWLMLCLNDCGTGSLRHSLQDRLSKAASSGKGRSDEINVKLCTSTGWFVPLF